MFPTNNITDPLKSPSGELRNGAQIVAKTNFTDGLQFGRFAKLSAGDLVENMNGSATPTIAGPVVRDLTNAIEDGLTYTNKYTKTVSVGVLGMMTVDAIAGESPTFLAPIYARNSGASDFGKASISSTNGILTNARFIEKVTDTVWVVLIA